MGTLYFCEYVPEMSNQRLNGLQNDMDNIITFYNGVLSRRSQGFEIRLRQYNEVHTEFQRILQMYPGLELKQDLLETLNLRIKEQTNMGG